MQRQIGSSPVLKRMVEAGIPLTRENFIDLNWLGKPPEEWTAEHEADLPEMFRRGEHTG